MAQGIVSCIVWFSLFLMIHDVLFHRKHIENCFSLIIRIYLACVAGHFATVIFLDRAGSPGSYGHSTLWPVRDGGFVHSLHAVLLQRC